MIKRLESVHESVFGTIDLQFFDDEILSRSFSKDSFYNDYQKTFFCSSGSIFDLKSVGKLMELKNEFDKFNTCVDAEIEVGSRVLLKQHLNPSLISGHDSRQGKKSIAKSFVKRSNHEQTI